MKDLRIHHRLLEQCWEVILRKDTMELADQRAPLVNMEEIVAYFKLQPYPHLRQQIERTSVVQPNQPGFKNLSEEILLALRQNLYITADMDTVTLWAEKLMRFCEIQFPTLKGRAVAKWGDRSAARLHMLHLAVLLLDYYLYSKDLRFLNTVLKLADSGWLISGKTLLRDLKEGKGSFVSALFQFRILLITEYALDHLQKGATL